MTQNEIDNSMAPKKDIIVRLRGGLGNQMFQYAMGRVLALKDNARLKLDVTGYEQSVQGDTPRNYRLQFFNIKADIATPEEVRSSKYPLGFFSKLMRAFSQKILKRHYVDYHPELLVKRSLRYVDGFFQSELYFKNIRPAILEDFTLKPEFISPLTRDLMTNIESSPNTVFLHVRRGDYVTNVNAKKVHGECSPEYYRQAILRIGQEIINPHFFIFSDDIEWVKKNMEIGHVATYVSNPNLTDYEELMLMAACKHGIIANSTFSWWGAWLCTNPAKVIIAPSRWTVSNTDHPNIIPKTWVQI
jgi:hypothetical protein